MLSIFMVLTFTITGCKEETVEEVTEEETAEEVTEEEEQTFEEQVAAHVAENPIIKLLASPDMWYDAHTKIIEDFEKETGYDVQIELIPGGQEGLNIVQSRFLSGEVPDIMQWLPQEKNILPLNPSKNLLPLNDQEWTDKILDDIFKRHIKMDGNIYFMPMGAAGIYGYFYNKEIFNKAGVTIPKSMIEILEVTAPKIKEAGFAPVYGMGKDQWALTIELYGYCADQFIETDVYEKLKRNEIRWEETDMLAAFEWQKEMQDSGFYNSDLLVGTFDGAITALSDGTAAMSSMVDAVWPMYSEEVLDNIGAFCVSKESTKSMDGGLAAGLSIPTGSNNMNGALDLVKWFTQDHILQKYYEESKEVPTYKNIGYESLARITREMRESLQGEPTWYGDFKATVGLEGTYSAMMFAGATPLEACTALGEAFIKSAKELGLPGFE